MFKIITSNLDKIGLILNIIGTLLVAFAFGILKEDTTRMGIGNGKFYKFVYFLHRKFFYNGICFLILGFILQLIN